MNVEINSPDINKSHWKSHLALAVICTFIGLAIYIFGWANYVLVSVLISLGIGFTIRFSRYWLKSQYPDMSLSLQYFFAVLVSFLVWGGTPVIFGLMHSFKAPADDLQRYLGIFFIGSLTMILVSFVYFRSEQTSMLKRSLYQAELDQSEKDKLLLETQLRLLQSQIEPHFLFNTLANIQALIATDTRQASKMLTALTELLRQSLDRTRTEWLTLEHELIFNKAYLAIQQIRLGDRLNVEYDFADCAFDEISFPPMLLQPLIENAIIHGIEQLKEGGTLKLKIQVSEQILIINIFNHCAPSGSQHTSTHVGLCNVRERLSQLYNERAKFTYNKSEANQVSVTLEVPMYVSSS